MTRGNYNLAAAGPSIKTALDALSSDHLAVGRQHATAFFACGRATVPLSDRSFEDYGSAVAGVAATPSPDLRIGYELGYLDAQFVYPITPEFGVCDR